MCPAGIQSQRQGLTEDGTQVDGGVARARNQLDLECLRNPFSNAEAANGERGTHPRERKLGRCHCSDDLLVDCAARRCRLALFDERLGAPERAALT